MCSAAALTNGFSLHNDFYWWRLSFVRWKLYTITSFKSRLNFLWVLQKLREMKDLKSLIVYHPSVHCWQNMSKTKYMHVLITLFVVEVGEKVLTISLCLGFILIFLVGSDFRPRHWVESFLRCTWGVLHESCFSLQLNFVFDLTCSARTCQNCLW